MDTPLRITFKDMDSSEFLERLIRERASRLERFHGHIVDCRVVVEVPHRSPDSGKTPIGIAVEVHVPGKRTIVAREQEERREKKNDHTALINRAFEAIERQLTELADVQGGEVKAHASAGEAGVIVRLFREEGYGFVEVRGSPDLFFAEAAVEGGNFDDLEIGTFVHVNRATAEGPMGPQASSVKILNRRKSPA